MHGNCTMLGYISYHVGSLFWINVHPYLKFMATLTLRRAAATYSRGPKGMKAWQLLLDWLTPAEWARLTRAAVGVCREVQWVRTVARNTHGNTRRCYNKLLSYSNIPIFSMTPERYISLPFIVGGVGGVILLVHHHFSTTMMILPGARKRWRLTVILVVFVKSSSIMIAICNL